MKHQKLGRPPNDAQDCERWTGTEWVPDDGQLGLAFSYRDSKLFPYALAGYCECLGYDVNCPRSVASHRNVERWRCSNGKFFL